MNRYKIEFPDTDYPTIELDKNAKLSEYLTPTNSPLLFGCCNGICATCLIELEGADGLIAPPDEEEFETLEIYAAENLKARLACQLKLTANIKIRKIDPT